MLKRYTNLKVCMFMFLLITGAIITACNNDDDGNPSNLIQLKSFGPSPALRGGELRFIGTNLDKITSIVLPGDVEVTSFVTKTPALIVIEVPEETIEGIVVLKTPNGEIETKTILGISEPISITSIEPTVVRPGETITIKGTYLNLIEQIVFNNSKVATDFDSQSKSTIELRVPDDAQTGKLMLSTGVESDEEIPIEVESEMELEVTLPQATGLAPQTLRPGADLTIKGTDLDLATAVIFPGGARIEKEDFIWTEEGDIVVTVPSSSQDGKVRLVAPSLVEVESEEALEMVAPTIVSVTPNPAKTGGSITVTGTNLDLITSVSFNGQIEGEGDEAALGQTEGEILDGGTATEITVKIPADATEGLVNFHTDANKSLASSDILGLVKPIISSFTPTVNTVDEPNITITGTNLDIVSEVVFEGNYRVEVMNGTETNITIAVPPGSVSGPITLITTNGTEVVSNTDFVIIPDVPNVTGVPSEVYIGEYLTLTGTNMDVFTDIYFPGKISATHFGIKNSTTVQVRIPMSVKKGKGVVTFVTSKNEVYETSVIDFKLAGAEPVVDSKLVIHSFDIHVSPTDEQDDWGGNIEFAEDPEISFSGRYLHGTNPALSGWAWIWGCNHAGLPKPGGITKADHVFKIDVYFTVAPPSDANFEMAFNGNRVSLGNLGASTTPNWVTLTWDLSEFEALPDVINPDNKQDGEWGLNLGSGTVDMTGVFMDNFRFQKK